MFCAHLAMLEDGRVFVNGGRNQTNSPWTSIFDFRDNEWVQIENMDSGGRWYPTTLALANGDIFTAIGTATVQRYPERWNVDDGWEIKNGIDFNEMVLDDYFSTGSHGESRWWPLLHVAPNGQVFHSGPTPKMHYIDPDGNGTYEQAGPEFTDFYHKHGTTIMYDEGKLLTAGGWISGTNIASTNKAFTVDLNGPSPTISATSDMAFARKFHNGVLLPTGEVLVIGGNTSGQKFSDNGAILEVEIWDPDTGVWTVGSAMDVPRNYHSIALLLNDGRVLAAGSGYCAGNAACGGSSHRDGQVYSPPYLFNDDGTLASRPAVSSAPGRIASSESFTVNATADLQRFTMIKMGSTTHGVNTDVRFLEVPFSETSPGVYELTAHSNRNVLTPGYWMLFGIDSNGVPSVAHVLQANTSGNPWLAMIPQQSSREGDPVSVQIHAGDADDDPLVYSATGLPDGLSINSTTGEITGAASATGFYDVTVTVDDNDEGARSRDFSWLVFGQGLGSIQRSWWTGISGTDVSDLTTDPRFPDSPSGTDSMSSFEAPVNWADNYGTRMHGYVTPDLSGAYTFWISSDDAGELWLSTDSNPANKQLIARVPGWSSSRQWTKYAEQRSVVVQLEANQTYYIEALQKEGGGGDNLAVAWTRPGESDIEIIPGAYLSPNNVGIDAPVQAKLDSGIVRNVGDEWVTVDLVQSYTSMIVVATPSYGVSDLPVVARVRETAPNQFELRVQNPGGSDIPADYDVHYLVAEKGVYAGGGAFLEAALINVSTVDSDSSWAGNPVAYQQSYANPVVVGQIMGDAGTGWSSFWASDGVAGNPPSGLSLFVGRHVAEDSDVTRSDEQLAYIVFESGSYEVGNSIIEANVGGASVGGIADSPPYIYSLTAAADTTVLSSAGMNGQNGGWPILYDSTSFPTAQIGLAIDEDQIVDSERSHTDEDVAIVSIATAPNEPLSVGPVVTTPQTIGSMINFGVSATGGPALEYNWSFGDGSPETGFGPNASIQHNYSGPGRYIVSVTVRDPNTLEEVTLQFTQLVHRPLTANSPTSSSTIALNETLSQVWNVNPDNDTVTIITDVAAGISTEVATDRRPTAVQISPAGEAWVVNRDTASIAVFDTSSFNRSLTIQLPFASAPSGVAFDHSENVAFVTLEATGELIKLDASTGAMLGYVYVGDNPRHVSVNSDGTKVFVTRFITPTLPDEWTGTPIVEAGGQQFGGEALVIDPFSMTVLSTAVLEHSDRGVSEHTGPGVPNYLGPAVISPDGSSAWIPSKQDNILAGALRGGPGMTFDQTVRAVTSMIDLSTDAEDFSFRIDHDNASVANYAAFGPFGATLFTALEGNREIAVNDVYTATEISRFDVGRAPHGIAVSGDGNTLYVHNFMDRTVGAYDVSGVTSSNSLAVTEINTIPTVSVEQLTASELNGKQLFYDARDPRLALDSYMSCASCHNDGGQDGRVWDFTGVGEGLRNTITLKGRAAMAHGFLHWSANFDELQDFEDQIRNFSVGTGLMDDADYNDGSRSTPLGDPKAGISSDLDDLAAYVESLDSFESSPHRNADGTLTPEGEAGRLLFESKGCASCHAAPRFTDSGAVVLHDVGTIKSSSGNRLFGSLVGLDTPTLLSVWNTGPYLHDGSALDVTEAIAAHDSIVLTVQDLNELGAYLDQLDSVTAQIETPNTPPTISSPGDQSGETGESVSLSIAASDADGDVLTFSATGLPSGLGINPGSGLISGAPTAAGSHSVTVIVSDGTDSASTTFNWSVSVTNTPPTISSPGDQSTELNSSVSLLIVANDADGDALTYSASGLPVGLGINSGSGLISGAPTVAGSHSVTVVVSDGIDSASTNFNWSVSVTNTPPTISSPGDQSGETGESVSLSIAASDADGDVLTFSATGLPSGLGINPGSGLISGAPTAAGSHSVTVIVSDGTDSASTTFNWSVSVTNTPPTISSPGDQSTELNSSVSLLIVANDADGDALTYSASGLPVGLGINSGSGLISGVPTVAGSHSVTVTVNDGTNSATTTFAWTVCDPSGGCDTLDFFVYVTESYAGQDRSENVSIENSGSTIVLSDNTWRRTVQTFNITPGTVLEFDYEAVGEAEIMGIGFDETDSISDDRVFKLFGTQNVPWDIGDFETHSGSGTTHYQIPVGQYFSGPAMHLVFVNDDDAGTGTSSRFSNVRIIGEGELNVAPSIIDPGSQSTELNSSVSLSIVASDADGDALTFSATGLPPGLVMNSATGQIAGTVSTAGSYVVSVAVSDGNGGTDDVDFAWTVCDPSGGCDTLDFFVYVTESYAGQDISENVAVEDGGSTIVLSDNTWRRTVQTFNITPGTVLEFDYEAVGEAEIMGIGFDETDSISDDRVFKLFGTQNVPWDIGDFETHSGSGTTHYQIPVGQYFSGPAMHLVFVNDDDAGTGTSSRFSNVRIIGEGELNAPPSIVDPGSQSTELNSSVSLSIVASDADGDALTYSASGLPVGLGINSGSGLISGVPTVAGSHSVTVTVNDGTNSATTTFAWTVCDPSGGCDTLDFFVYVTESYAGQDRSENVSIENSGSTIVLSDNTWRRTVQTFNITPGTVLEFDYEAVGEAEIMGIGFDETDSISDDRVFKLFGTQNVPWDIGDFETHSGSGTTHYQIPVGQYFSGPAMHLVFVNDDDAGTGTSSRFSNVRVYQTSQN